MNVNEKGNLGLIKVIADLYSKGYHCFTPFDDHSPVDLISLDKSGQVRRLQVKYRSLYEKRNYYEISATTVINGKGRPIDRNLIDGWAIYLSNIDKVVYMPIDKMNGKGVHHIKPDDVKDLGEVP
jgi:hypothetical protein